MFSIFLFKYCRSNVLLMFILFCTAYGIQIFADQKIFIPQLLYWLFLKKKARKFYKCNLIVN